MHLRGANTRPNLSEEQPLPGTVNYLVGRDPIKWQTQVPTFGKVRYTGVYPGTDLIFYGRQGRLEFDIRLEPGANPDKIQLAFNGVGAHLRLDRDGNLLLGADDGSFSDAENVYGDPIHSGAKIRESPVHDDELSVRNDGTRLVFQCERETSNEIEQALATRFDVSPVLDVVWRPEPFCGRIVSLVEEQVECG